MTRQTVSFKDAIDYYRPSPAWWIDSNGILQTAGIDEPRFTESGILYEDPSENLFLNSDAPATQTITVTSGDTYTISVYGTGDITLSDAGTGVVTQGSPVTITASTTSLTCTVNDVVNYAQVEEGSRATSIIITGGSKKMRAKDNVKTKGFDPKELFANGEQGVLYIPRPPYLYQDSAGTTPVTADGDPVGLMLDLHKGLVRGPDVVSIAWEGARNNETLTTVDGKLRITATAAGAFGVSALAAMEDGTYFEHTASGLGASPGISFLEYRANISSAMQTSNNKALDVLGQSNFRFLFNDLAEQYVGFIAIADAPGDYIEFEVGTVSVKELPGNHATQATAAAKPLYRTDGTLHWLEYDGVDDRLVTTNFSADKTVMLAVRRKNLGDLVLASESGTGIKFLFVVQSGNTAGALGNVVGTPTYYVDGAAVTTRDALHNETADLGFHIIEATGVDISSWAQLRIGAYDQYTSGFDMPGMIVMEGSDTAQRSEARNYLADLSGVTL